ncbi:MAG: class II aldolase/adducin family protein [Methylococcales bacterium]
MPETEGVIKYKLDHQDIAFDENIAVSDINACRTLLFKLQLIGQLNDRYAGYGFGNISQRINPLNPDTIQFIISGTQTGGIETLSRQHYSYVTKATPEKNIIHSIGKTKPSSEALTHASVYRQDKKIQAVIHVHSPEIWHNTEQLKLAHTSASIAYGTPEMATEVARLMQTKQLKDEKIFSMLGHKDGIVAFSNSIESATLRVIKYYSRAIKFEQSKRHS